MDMNNKITLVSYPKTVRICTKTQFIFYYNNQKGYIFDKKIEN